MGSQSWKELFKKGNKSSATAAGGNLIIAIAKTIAAVVSGSGAMLATALHSYADTINQGFVYFGSVLAQKNPTPRFPTGFGRVINLFVMVAVLIVTVLGYESVKEGWHLIQHPKESGAFWLNISVLILNVVIDGGILIKVMKEINKEARDESVSGFQIIPGAIRNLPDATPPTRLVFFEDVVAVTGAFLAIIAVIVTTFTNFAMLDGISTLLIGVLMLAVALRIGYENTLGLIGVSAPKDVEEDVGYMILEHDQVEDIRKLRVVKEGRAYHVEAMLELTPGLSLAEADDIKFKVWDKLLNSPDISDVTLGIIESNEKKDWDPDQKEQKEVKEWDNPKENEEEK
ncbi:cation diffusion facilitator family transporter [Pontibacillus marinus]|uniref:Cobalt transporter n=1 Tax=Pontibacillus marinus BH030004 = DSM 16465 TaxID=1385511 RepID=A0A0A5GFJ2_9BACI|nr:cation diffusion facilitator family transporter [Pontibacillus marinus]KGX89890.1 cobalt transporter [Pontibacillus marinus BH030004 = DSM 16465]